MLVLLVDVHVVKGMEDAFREATIRNASHSVKEPGIARFDVLQDEADPCRFVLVEVYRDDDAPARHKETSHYKEWREVVAPMMARARTARRLANAFPEDADW